MKNILYIPIIAFLFSSCELNEVPKATATEDDIFGTESGLRAYSYSFYNNITSGSDAFKGDAMSDYAAVNSLNSFMVEGGYSAETSTGWSWSALRNINHFIDKCTRPEVSEAIRNNYLGIARFFRAWFYYDKLVRFGNVPWIDHAISADEQELLYATQDSREVIVKHILEDLDFAYQNISDSGEDGTLINKWTALALKTRVALFEASYRKYHQLTLETSTTNLFQQVVEAGKILIEQSPYSLNTAQGVEASQRQLFISTAPVKTEVLLAIAFNKEQAIMNDANWWWTSATYGPRLSLTRPFINTILNLDGTPYTDRSNYDQQEFYEECQNRDYRLKQLIRTPGYTRSGVAAPPNFASHTYTGYQPIKYTLDDPYYDNGAYNINAVPLIRFAEVLLNYAEAKAELSDLNENDWKLTIGALRARSGVTGGINQLPTKVDNFLRQTFFPSISDPVLLEVRRERQIELALEGFRFNDLKRWKLGNLMATLPWTGIYVPALNQLIDLDHNGTPDVMFYNGSQTAPSKDVLKGAAAVAVGGPTSNFQTLTADSHLEWFKAQPRFWYANGRQYLYPIPANAITLNENLKQNPGWE